MKLNLKVAAAVAAAMGLTGGAANASTLAAASENYSQQGQALPGSTAAQALPAITVTLGVSEAIASTTTSSAEPIPTPTSNNTSASVTPRDVTSNTTYDKSRLNPAFTFDTLVTGRANDLARAAAQQAVKNGAISADEVAEITFKAVADDRFYVFPSPEALPLVKARIDHVLNQTNPDLPYDLVPALKQRRDRILSALAQ